MKKHRQPSHRRARSPWVGFLVVVLLTAVFQMACSAPPPPRPVVEHFASPAYGIHLSQWWHIDALQRDIDLTKQMGFGWVKQNFPWREIEAHEKGKYDWFRPDEIVGRVETADLNLIVRLDRNPIWSVQELFDQKLATEHQPPLDYQDFGDFCFAVAERYQGRIAAYQVWNEPNLSREWGRVSPNPAEYTELLRVCYEGIKRGDPEAIVVTAGLAPTGTQPPDAMPPVDFLQGMYDAGAADYFDVLGVNAPGFNSAPEVSPDDSPERWQVFRYVEDQRDVMVQNGDAHKQVAILEMGWILEQDFHEIYSWFGVSEETQADYLVRAYQYAKENWSPWMGLMTTIYFADVDWQPEADEQYWWSIVQPDGTPREAYFALQAMEKSK